MSVPLEEGLDSFYSELAEKHLDALWRLGPAIQSRTPRNPGRPYLWRWAELQPLLERSTRLVNLERGAERRVLLLVHPDLSGGTTPTMTASVQMILPGEVAPSHRHTPAAIRFILSGSGAYTDVEGERIGMEEGDLILTPSWTWHDHGNETDRPIVWFDGLDAPLVRALRADFFEPDETLQHRLLRPSGHTPRRVGSGLLRPVAARAGFGGEGVLPLIYRWREVARELRRQAEGEGDPWDGVALQYVNPVTGGSTLPTLDCWIQLLRPGEHTQAHRHTGSAIYRVFRGEGYSVIDGRRLDWREGDTLALPSWAWHEHANTGEGEAILFSMNDAPVLRALGLYREEAWPGEGGRQAG